MVNWPGLGHDRPFCHFGTIGNGRERSVEHSIARRLAALAVTAAALAASGLAAFSADSGPQAPDDASARVIAAAKEQLGDPYEWGAAGPDRWDCSGLTSTLWREVGGVHSIPRVSYAQAAWAIPVAAADALPGDLVFFDNPVSHVSLYLGEGKVIDGSSSRGEVVIRAVWPAEMVSYGRVPRPTMTPVRVVRGSRGALRAPPVKVAGTRRPAAVTEDGRLNAVPPLGAVSRRPLRPPVARLRAFALASVGAPYAARGRGPSYDAGGLVSATWRRAGGGILPTTAAALEMRTTRVRVRDVVPGDFVFYGSPAMHVGIYIGAGRMVDASRALGKVVQRPVFRSDTVRFARLTPARRTPLARRTPATTRTSTARKKSTVRKKPAIRTKATPRRKPAAATPVKAPPPLRSTAGATKRRPLPARRPVATPARPPRKR